MRAHVPLLLASLVGPWSAPVARAAPERVDPPADDETSPATPLACSTSDTCSALLGQGFVCSAGRCTEYYDRRDLYGLFGLRTAAASGPKPLVPLVAAIPTIGFSPNNGLMLGVGGTVGILLGDPSDTPMSNATGSIMYTAERQLIVSVAATTVTAGGGWELLSDWRFLVYNESTYGLGTGGTPLGDAISLNGWGALEAVEGAQPMDFDLVRIHQNVLRQVFGRVYLGLGYRLDRYYNIVDRQLDLSSTPAVVTSHYAYSRIEGFDPARYTASGLGVEAMSDTSDSTIAPYRGWYAHLRFTGYPTWLGSTKAATDAAAEVRWYRGLSSQDPRNLIALRGMLAGVTSGKLPYLALPASGWDQRGTTGRGYVQGRFRGTATAYAEAEWRFRLTSDGLLGGTVFASAQSFARPAVSLPQLGYSEPGEHLFGAFRLAGGVGLRILAMKQSRTSLRVDVASGERSVGFYLGAGEAF